MANINNSIEFFLELTTAHTAISRKFDNGLGGISLNEFMILYHLSNAKDEQMRRIDLADKIGLTPSGITRLLAPMEKIGLIKKETNVKDARVSFVSLAKGGKMKLEEGIDRAQVISKDILSALEIKDTKEFTKVLGKISRLRY